MWVRRNGRRSVCAQKRRRRKKIVYLLFAIYFCVLFFFTERHCFTIHDKRKKLNNGMFAYIINRVHIIYIHNKRAERHSCGTFLLPDVFDELKLDRKCSKNHSRSLLILHISRLYTFFIVQLSRQ